MPAVRWLLALAALSLACRSATDVNDTQLAIATDHLMYHIDSGDVVHFQLVNRGPEPIYAALPGGFVSVQKQRGLAWVDLGPFWYGSYTQVAFVPGPWMIEAGDSLPGMPLPTLDPHLRGPGRFRFVYIVYSDSTLHRLLPLEARVSNVFKIDY
jgi:hypothetical protein